MPRSASTDPPVPEQPPERLPRYPVYVPSKGRAGACLTARFLTRDRCPFYLVVVPSEEEAYRREFPDAEILVLPGEDLRLLGTRLWIREHSEAAGHERHWQLDDNAQDIRRLYRGRRIRAAAGLALRTVEDFVDRYENVGVAGLNYQMFVTPQTRDPYFLNVHVYSCSLIWNRMPHTWRLLYNDDTDLCLQVLSGGLCTVLFNVFMFDKVPTMTVRGGNTDDLYQGDGRLRMARALEREWPGVVTTKRRFRRPQHVVKGSWKHFDTPLIRRPDVDFSALPPVDEYGAELRAIREVRSPGIAATLEAWEGERAGG